MTSPSPRPQLDDEAAIQIVHNLIGDDTIPVTIRSTSLWGNNKMYATRYREGRVFCMGDAVHRHPPSNGLGSNTSVQDAYNLAWKLAYVLRGTRELACSTATTPSARRSADQIVLRANQSIEEFGPIFAALGFADTKDPDVMNERMRARADNTPEAAAQRAQLREALELKDYEFNAHGVELGQRYRSAAVVSDGTPEPPYARDPELYYHPTTWPGARLPHCWLGTGGHRVSTHDLAGKGRFALLTGISGEPWAAAADAVARAARDRDRRPRHRPGTRVHRSLRRLGAPARGRRGRLRAHPPRRPRGLALGDAQRRPSGRAARRPDRDPRTDNPGAT